MCVTCMISYSSEALGLGMNTQNLHILVSNGNTIKSFYPSAMIGWNMR